MEEELVGDDQQEKQIIQQLEEHLDDVNILVDILERKADALNKKLLAVLEENKREREQQMKLQQQEQLEQMQQIDQELKNELIQQQNDTQMAETTETQFHTNHTHIDTNNSTSKDSQST